MAVRITFFFSGRLQVMKLRKRRDEENMWDSLVLEEGMILKFPLVYFATFAAPSLRFFPARRSKTTTL